CIVIFASIGYANHLNRATDGRRTFTSLVLGFASCSRPLHIDYDQTLVLRYDFKRLIDSHGTEPNEMRVKIVQPGTNNSIWSVPLPDKNYKSVLSDNYLFLSYHSYHDFYSDGDPVQTVAIRLQDGKIQWKNAASDILNFTAVGEEIVVFLKNGNLEVWNSYNGEKSATLDTGIDESEVESCNLSAFGNYFVFSTPYWVRVYDMEKRKLCHDQLILEKYQIGDDYGGVIEVYIDTKLNWLAYNCYPYLFVVNLCSKEVVFKYKCDYDPNYLCDPFDIILHPPYLFFEEFPASLCALNMETNELEYIEYWESSENFEDVSNQSLKITERLLLLSYKNDQNGQYRTSFIDPSTLEVIANHPGRFFLNHSTLVSFEGENILFDDYLVG
ncbi:MAG: hypothetical protein K940chlam7_00988, partial [Chlamydiae bacterium]|nr:hypothetical protein [Chlamydiota bacterium]